MHQLETVSKLLRLEKEKVIETEENYRKIIDEAKNEHEKQF